MQGKRKERYISKQRNRLRSTAKAAVKDKIPYWYLALMGVHIALIVWSFSILKRTFISNYAVLLAAFIIGIILSVLVRKIKKPHPLHSFYTYFPFFSFGAIVGGVALLALNYYITTGPVKMVQLPIQSAGVTHSKGTPIPFVTVMYDNVEIDIRFSAVMKEQVYKARFVDAKLEKGILGFYRYSGGKLAQ